MISPPILHNPFNVPVNNVRPVPGTNLDKSISKLRRPLCCMQEQTTDIKTQGSNQILEGRILEPVLQNPSLRWQNLGNSCKARSQRSWRTGDIFCVYNSIDQDTLDLDVKRNGILHL